MIRIKDRCHVSAKHGQVILKQSEANALDFVVLSIEGTYGLCIALDCFVCLRTFIDLVYEIPFICYAYATHHCEMKEGICFNVNVLFALTYQTTNER